MSESTETQTARSSVVLIASMVCLVGIFGLQAWQVFGGQAARVQQWQYTIESPEDSELLQRLAALGADGWEVVSARRATSSGGIGESKASYEMILKRPRSAGDAQAMPVTLPDK